MSSGKEIEGSLEYVQISKSFLGEKAFFEERQPLLASQMANLAIAQAQLVREVWDQAVEPVFVGLVVIPSGEGAVADGSNGTVYEVFRLRETTKNDRPPRSHYYRLTTTGLEPIVFIPDEGMGHLSIDGQRIDSGSTFQERRPAFYPLTPEFVIPEEKDEKTAEQFRQLVYDYLDDLVSDGRPVQDPDKADVLALSTAAAAYQVRNQRLTWFSAGLRKGYMADRAA